MVAAQDLRIGNYVEDEYGNIGIVKSIDGEKTLVFIRDIIEKQGSFTLNSEEYSTMIPYELLKQSLITVQKK